MKKKDPERPACNTCGKPATCVIELRVHDLILLETQHACRSERYWGGDWRNERSVVKARLCETCFGQAINVKIEVDASVQGEGEK